MQFAPPNYDQLLTRVEPNCYRWVDHAAAPRAYTRKQTRYGETFRTRANARHPCSRREAVRLNGTREADEAGDR